ncbi:transposase [Micromonospora rifamycinica]|uniref:transposase n=1 Tax=Micromonospora rifamycinica TaxID=291594 RepID=UPI0039A4FF25
MALVELRSPGIGLRIRRLGVRVPSGALHDQGRDQRKRWLRAGCLTELCNRGVEDVFSACSDGLKGMTDAVEQVWPQAVHQQCVPGIPVVHESQGLAEDHPGVAGQSARTRTSCATATRYSDRRSEVAGRL